MSTYFSDQLQQLQKSAAADELVFRRDALEVFQTYGMPRRKQDPWKYTDNSALLNLPLNPPSPADTADSVPQVTAEPSAKIPLQEICFLNDVLLSQTSSEKISAQDAKIRSLELKADGELNLNPTKWQLDKDNLEEEENSYSLINAFSFSSAYELKPSPPASEGAPEQNLRLRFQGQNSYQAPRLYIDVPAGADVRILLDTRELGPNVYWNPYFFFNVGPAARLTLLERGPKLSGSDPNTGTGHVRSVTLRGKIAESAVVNAALFYWNTELAVHDTRFTIEGENAHVCMRGICFGEGRSAYHLRCENRHSAPNSKSENLYKNVLFDKATSEFYGIIHADSNGMGTDAVQKNRNLLLSNEARAIARPQLEILIDDLKCSHGSSTGSIDPEELFYMRSRGLSHYEATNLAVVGFVEEISTYFDEKLLETLGIEDCLHTLLSKRNS
ncbi:SufD family Fe-S cluster assembly protein [Candidatus Haliotispira prima]|uniref:SufD family Fe-S cluster assembly protein n=1 Tax=Candidatus Haliotispira prima TaxID=3034016 RepID=A0ABY8MH45_9SPIO|nr:SufD family Fe-S cluster assembly protein [Candidatus Haliotispira prima]